MKIGIDAKWFFNGNPSGSEVVRNLVKELIKMDNKNYYYIFLDKKDKHLLFPYKSDKIKIIYVWAGINAISNIFVLPMVAWQYNIDVFLLQYFTPFISNFKKIVYVHDAIFKSHPQYFSFLEKLYFLPIKLLSYFADIVITVSNSEKKRLIKYSFAKDPSKIKVVYNGFNKKFRPLNEIKEGVVSKTKKKFGLPDKYLLYVGRLNERKNILNLLKSVQRLKDIEIKIVLVGKYDWKMFDLPRKIKELNIIKRVLLLDYVDDEYLPALYSLATIFCYVSLQEGFGLPPLEAMASGVPIVISNTSSLPEICGEAGTYCNPNDPQDIAEKIDILLSDDILYEKKKEIGLSVSKPFDWSQSAKKILEIFDSVKKT